MPSNPVKQDALSSLPMNCWLIRRHSQQGLQEYVARFEATALMIWDYMQHDVLIHGPAPARMVLVWRLANGQERTLASMDVESKI